jgi:di/tripeptidase
MKTTLILFLAIMAIGCASTSNKQYVTSPSKQYSEANYPKVQTGEMKWSDYYKGLYDKVSMERNLTTGDELLALNGLIDTARDYEANKITKDQFESKRREVQANLTKMASDYQLKQAEIQASQPAPEPSGYKPYIRKSRPLPPPVQMPRTTNCSTWGNQTSCTTY